MAIAELEVQASTTVPKWSYAEAFKRNRGLITAEEQEKLRKSRVAIAGMGGVGGLHLITLARLGIGKFTIADPDAFDIANTNRQYGATRTNFGRNKAEAMAEAAININPELDIRIIPGKVASSNIDIFLKDADLYVDGIDLYAINARRLIFKKCAEQNLFAVTAGPMGFSTGWLVFAPDGMAFDQYFDFTDDQTELEKIIGFIVGLCPKALHLAHLDLSFVEPAEKSAPSVSAGCELATGVTGSLVSKLLLRRGTVKCVPYYQQFDAYNPRLITSRLRNGNRGLLQRLKRKWLCKHWEKQLQDIELTRLTESTESILNGEIIS